MQAYQPGPKLATAGFPTFVMTVIAFLWGVFPLALYLLYLNIRHSPEAMKAWAWLHPEEAPRLPDVVVLWHVGILIVLYLVFLKKIRNSWVWVHTYILSALTSTFMIWINENALAHHPLAAHLPFLAHISAAVQVLALVVFRALYVLTIIEPWVEQEKVRLEGHGG